MFTDQRSKKVVLVAHCILNQNAKIDRCASFPGMVPEIVRVLLDAGVGIVQMPCPELMALGLDRGVEPGVAVTIESEDTRVERRMQAGEVLALCRRASAGLVYQVKEYRRNGFDVLGVIGVNGSPTCGIEAGWADDRETSRPGVFIKILKDELDHAGIDLPMRGVKVYRLEEAVKQVKELVSPKS
jgi:predicted secreted protein